MTSGRCMQNLSSHTTKISIALLKNTFPLHEMQGLWYEWCNQGKIDWYIVGVNLPLPFNSLQRVFIKIRFYLQPARLIHWRTLHFIELATGTTYLSNFPHWPMLLPNRVRKFENDIKSSLGLEAWNNKLHDYKSQMSYYWYFVLKITERTLKLKIWQWVKVENSRKQSFKKCYRMEPVCLSHNALTLIELLVNSRKY